MDDTDNNALTLALARFFVAAWKEMRDPEADTGWLQELAAEAGMLGEERFDPEEHGDLEGHENGDTIYVGTHLSDQALALVEASKS